jgi:1-deoxy-D-xylulose-5-phosphate synthase|tara:strand:- start:140831 stop:142702 length:1872 start_codon:yes stop_codon:yes gene_type:complete
MKNFDSIPASAPSTLLLDKVQIPENMRGFNHAELLQLADELREYLVYVVGQTGGHFGAGLGVVELTIALHYVFNTPEDRLVWDVGHQAYPHKILTGRRGRILSLRQRDGLSGFPSRSESPFDTFGVGHSSTSISAALGMAMASKLKGENRKHTAVIGDGAMTAGMAFEALNHVAGSGADMMVVLNDNNMSISENVGALSSYFSRMWASPLYNQIRQKGQKVLSKVPPASEFVRRTEEHMKGLVSPGTFFEEMGFNYIGPIDGHNLKSLVDTLQNLRELKEPILLHVITEKGRGFTPAEEDPIAYHALSKIDPAPKKPNGKAKLPKYQDIFGQWLCDMAESDARLVGITPAMREGSGMVEFSRQFPTRYVDVGIAEQHSVTLAAGMACENLKPVVAIYSTFLQRAYDQLIHDVALQDLDVLFALDRAGLVGEDGASHAGAYDISYLRCIPNMLVMTPSDENECRQLLTTGYQHKGPAAVRYPRGSGPGTEIQKDLTGLPIGKAIVRREGQDFAILAFGTVLADCLTAAEEVNATVVDMRFAKPIDEELLTDLTHSHTHFISVEENAVAGGAGSAVLELVSRANLDIKSAILGLPDSFQNQATRPQLLAEAGLDSDSIIARIRAL